jgi:citrate synthase
VVASTGADVAAAVVAAIGAFSGPLHGGAPDRELAALDEIGTPDRIDPWVRAKVVATLAELKPDRRLYANVEFYAGVVMELCGVPREMFTPTFAVSRVVGWAANILEQATERRIIRPAARYVGPPPPQPVPA